MAQRNDNATARTERTQVTIADTRVEGAAASRSTPSDATATGAARPTAREKGTREIICTQRHGRRYTIGRQGKSLELFRDGEVYRYRHPNDDRDDQRAPGLSANDL
jgi:hypothetical protein